MQLQVNENLEFTGDSLVEPAQEPELLVPGLEAVDITPSQDGGILKEVLRVADNNEQPLIGDRVLVHYEAMLATGQRVDSSRFRSDIGFEFVLGKGLVVKAWDLGVATMCAGEKARFYCQSYYLDNDQSQNNGIYPTCYDIELVSWQGEDISKRKDGGVLKSILERGRGRETPNDGATCEAHITGQFGSRTFEDRDVTFIMGEGIENGIVDGVELGLKKCKKGEKLRLHVKSKYAYMTEGCPSLDIPPNADLIYVVEMKDFVRIKDYWEMDIAELLSRAEQFKERGTHFFKLDKCELALNRYKKVVRYLSSETNVGGESGLAVRSLLLAAHLNMALCCLKLGDEVRARDCSDSALELDPNNIKGLYRRGMANLGLLCIEEADRDFNAILRLEPDNEAALRQLQLSKQKKCEGLAREKSMFAGMFDKFANSDQQKENAYGRSQSDVFSDIKHWSNELANGMMTLEQEMAAFGEKMPEPRYKNNDKENEHPVCSDDDC